MWGQEQTWIAGLSIILVSSATLAAAYFTDVGEKDKQRFTVGGVLFLIFGLVLLYVGLTILIEPRSLGYTTAPH
jgi:hypothetical protein